MTDRIRTFFRKIFGSADSSARDAGGSHELLERKIEFYEAIINNLPNDLVVFDTEHNYVLINNTAIHDPELRRQMLHKSDFEYCTLRKIPGYLALQRREKFKYVMDNRTSLNWEEAKKTNGKTEVISRTMRPVTGDDGGIRYVLGYGMDISNLRAAEEALLELNRHLQEQVEERTRELTESNRKLEHFAFAVSHDLRGPLRHISNYSSLLKRPAGQNSAADQAEYLDYIITSAKRMELQIDGLLRLSRIAHSPLDTEVVDMQPLFEDALEIYRGYYAAVQVDSEINCAVQVSADRSLMRSVIDNLISNAIKYSMPTGAVHLRVDCSQAVDEIVFAVRDRGIGFDMKDYERLFGVFQRLHTRQEAEGLGIGLSHVKQIIDRHGGRIWAESRVNEGTVFYFALPHRGHGTAATDVPVAQGGSL